MTSRSARPASTTARWRRSREAKRRGFRTIINATLFNTAEPEKVATFFDDVMAMGVDGISVSPGYAYERAPDQQHFLNRAQDQGAVPRDLRAAGQGGVEEEVVVQPVVDVPGLPGRQPNASIARRGAIPTRTYFGWQRPCYLLGEGYAKTFKELMETTDWDRYGTGNYEKCADCMVHSGYEASAVAETVRRPWRAAAQVLRGIRTEGAMAPEISLGAPAAGGIRVQPACGASGDADPGAQAGRRGRRSGRRGLIASGQNILLPDH